MAGGKAGAFVSSRYNFCVPLGELALMYNANTGAVLRFDGRDAVALARALCAKPCVVPDDCVSPAVFEQLVADGFCVPEDHDELAEIRDRYWQARARTPIVLTITTTMDCNLGCYYCYEERSNHQLGLYDVHSIVELADERLTRSRKRSLHVDWYGGEPLMNFGFMEAASEALQELCRVKRVRYSSSVISNGTCWPEEVGSFIQRHKIRQVQISFDGLRTNHDRRRRYRKGYALDGETSSFDRAVRLVDALLDHVRVDLHFNIDASNCGDAADFVRFARSRGWFARRFPAVVQPARLASYSERSRFMRKIELSLEVYNAVRAEVRREVAGEARVEESEAPDGLPYPKTSVCAALARNSVVVGADRRLYRCALQVNESYRSVGRLKATTPSRLPILGSPASHSDEQWWSAFDPTALPTCSRCSFLPICWGGCPKKHLERDVHAIAEQGAYWRANLARLIAGGVGEEAPQAFAFQEQDQFR